MADTSTSPVTDRPYFTSGSRTVCPPTMATPASAHAAAPPRRIASRIDIGSLSSQKKTRLRA
jgi:hypothetical protein